MRYWRVCLCVCLLLVSMTPQLASAQSDLGELVTDRPDFTESSVVVGTGVIQVESGTSLEFDGAGDAHSRTLTTPLALMRLGVSKTLELRLSSDGGLFSTYGQGASRFSTNAAADMEVGAKWAFFTHEPAGFALAVIPMVSLPVGSSLGSSGSYDPTVKLTWAKSLPSGFDLSGNYNVAAIRDDLGRYAEQAHSVSLAHEVGGGWGMYWEAFGFITSGRPYGAAWTVNSGVTHGIGGNAQFDVEVGRGVTAAAPDWFVGMGMAMRRAPWRRAVQ